MNNLDSYLNIANKIIQNKKIDDYIPLYPMLRKENAKLKNLKLEDTNLVGVNFFETNLKGIDFTTSNIEGIVVSIKDLKGAIVSEMQAIELAKLLGIIIK